jgi:hypothetical protein
MISQLAKNFEFEKIPALARTTVEDICRVGLAGRLTEKPSAEKCDD